MRRVIMLAASGLLCSKVAIAQTYTSFTTGNSLFDQCSATSSIAKEYCLGYIVGIADALSDVNSDGGTIQGARACPPKRNLSQGQVRDVVVQWLQRNPAIRHKGASGLVATAIAEAFPCR